MSSAFSVNAYIVDEQSQLLIAVDPFTAVQLSVDHFQFVQLNHLQSTFNKLLDSIKQDRKWFEEHYARRSSSTDILVYAQTERVLLNIVLPPDPTPSPYERARPSTSRVGADNSTSSGRLGAFISARIASRYNNAGREASEK